MRSCARVCRLSAASIHATSTLASRTHSAIVEMRAVFESVSTEGDDTLQVVQTLPDRRLPAFVRRPWPPTTQLCQDASSILRTQSCQFFGQLFYTCARCGHLQASVDPFSTRSKPYSAHVHAHEERPSCGCARFSLWQNATKRPLLARMRNVPHSLE
jgi:hypothetical protein